MGDTARLRPLCVYLMALSLTSGPAAEPLTTAEVKAAIVIDHSNDDDRIANFILPAARVEAEIFTCRAFIDQTWVLRLTGFPDGPIILPKPPLDSVTSVAYIDTAGDSQTWAASKYTVETPSGDHAGHATIQPTYAESTYPATRTIVDAVTITFVAGYGTAGSDVPEGIKRGILQMCQYDYDGEDDKPIPSQLWPFVARRFDLRFD